MRMLVALALTLGTFACVTPSKRAGAAPRCPEAGQLKCMAREVCSYDASRGCEACQCDPNWTPLPQAVNPQPLSPR